MAQFGAHGETKLTPVEFERVGRALAHVILLNEGDEVVLGQAWLAAPGILITCGHVVDQFMSNPGALIVKFPASGNRYQVNKIKLHPNFARQPDKLVKYDVAALSAELSKPESTLRGLPFAYNSEPPNDQILRAIRYPVHLGLLTDAPEPILQSGKILGRLNKQDNFHWLHDLALSPGDSGTALFDGPNIVAIHCGDTATLPGLNLPTTSIRLALWIDALRDLGLVASGTPARGATQVKAALIAFAISLALAFAGTSMIFLSTQGSPWKVDQPVVLPVDIGFNEPVLGYKPNERVSIDLAPRNDLNLYLFDVDEHGQVLCTYPLPGFSPMVKAGTKRTISRFGGNYLVASPSQEKLHLIALISNDPLVKDSDWAKDNPAGSPLTINADVLGERIKDFERLEPENVLHIELNAPRAL